MENRSQLGASHRIVIKIGSSSLAYATGKLNLGGIDLLVRQIADLHNEGRQVLLVTSGAIGAGAGKLGLGRRPRSIPEKQAAAAVGQGLLMHVYEKFFAEYGVTVGQVLVAREDFADRKRFINMRNTLCALLRFGVLPVINENDTVAVDEIKMGDNDYLSALVAGLVNADVLLLLSDVDGLYTGDPGRDPAARLIPSVREITPEVEALGGGSGSDLGTGGMATKLAAARMAMQSGVITVIARAHAREVIRRVLGGEEVGTVFWPAENKLEARKRWIAYGSAVAGSVKVDEGAARALIKQGKSLLPSGVIGVEGRFGVGDTVSIVDPQGREIARGIVNFTAAEIEKIKGVNTGDIAAILGPRSYEEVVHRNNMVLEIR
ncbi:MAG: glutamate 5-kinase [Bacillota bacterium]|nr:glutamate 5-kinase [Bacillota bacterium]